MANNDSIIDILDHAEQELTDGMWTIVGWFKASKTTDDENSTFNPKCHLVSIKKNGVVHKFA